MWFFHANGRFESSENGSRQHGQTPQIQEDGDDWPQEPKKIS